MGVSPAVRDLLTPLERRLPQLAWASLAVNVLIVVSGGVVRLTGSGLGCPTWPKCTEEAFTPHGAMSFHSAIEFGNRMVTFVIAAVAVATLAAAWRSARPGVRTLALVLALGVPAQAVIGGITVLTDLNPWTVAGHLLVSMAMIGVAVALVRRARPARLVPDGRGVPAGLRRLAQSVFAAGWAVLYLGTVVTGSGPHAGDADALRNGLDPESVSQLHTDLVFLLVGLSIALVLVTRGGDVPRELARAAVVLMGVEVAQGAIGFAQYFTGLPVVLVGLHLLGAALTSASMTWVLVAAVDPDAAADATTAGRPTRHRAGRDRVSG